MHSTQLCDVLRNPPLWDYALALYQRPGGADACLQLQDTAGADICELLWRCWLDHHALVPTEKAHNALDEIRAWQTEVTQPIRHLRRMLKPRAQHEQDVATLRNHLKEAELLAERETLRQFQAISETSHAVRKRQTDDDSLTMQLARCLTIHEPAQEAALATLTTQYTAHHP
ncbi:MULTISPECIES: TIGR02444 family protein [Chromohalobacter]|uniref:TIGR02444 family protein n=1 Tax=Chromohalobacter TaxID=42054 RepID=UPI001FFDA5AF|nr:MULTISPECIES: TIGR02444 family protein [Chromohalobacter]MCK2045823.1 TIGR02444 family protein [Chromohalobacter moromii]MCT8469218.1 TIGR02444 family protein [Chromohalobacter canadensis]MCT8472592.1 TIGR02444 family protein [Chromohalobacter canadensis]MCT8500045.1 TIGR02444 family protein [Chromohalobacter canadensis]